MHPLLNLASLKAGEEKQQLLSSSIRETAPVTFALSFVRSPVTITQYRQTLRRFFKHAGIQGKSLEEQGKAFLAQAKSTKNDASNQYWVEDVIMSFLESHKKRFQEGKLAAASLGSFFWPIKAFCDAYKRDLPVVDWDMLSRLLPAAKSYANDRAPTIEEIRKLVKFPDRRIRVIDCVMRSSGIRVGA